MLPFFKRKNKGQVTKTGLDSSVSSEDLLNITEDSYSEEVETSLSFHPGWNLSKEQEYVFRFLNNDLTSLKPNQISLAGVELEREGNTLQVTAFVRNSLSKPIKLGEVELLLLNNEKKTIAQKQFDLSLLDKIPARSSRPWMFTFEKETVVSDLNLEEDGWSIAFNVSSLQPHRLDLAESWKENISEDIKTKLINIVNSVPKPKPKEFNIMGVSAKFLENGDLNTTVLLRNGNHKGISIQQLPLEVIDANNELVVRGAFKLEDFEVKANTSKPWSFIFPKEMIQKENPDFSKWSVRPILNK
jgi:accessory Sec system S-layer assembly protein